MKQILKKQRGSTPLAERIKKSGTKVTRCSQFLVTAALSCCMNDMQSQSVYTCIDTDWLRHSCTNSISVTVQHRPAYLCMMMWWCELGMEKRSWIKMSYAFLKSISRLEKKKWKELKKEAQWHLSLGGKYLARCWTFCRCVGSRDIWASVRSDFDKGQVVRAPWLGLSSGLIQWIGFYYITWTAGWMCRV